MIHLGDGLDLMRSLPDASVDLLCTDSPYGTTALAFDQRPIDWPAWWAEARRVTKPTAPIVMFAADLFTVDLIGMARDIYRYRLVWEKTLATGHLNANKRPMKAHEDIVVFAQQFGGSTYNPQKTAGHPLYHVGQGRQPCAYTGTEREPGVRRGDGTRHPRSVLKFAQEPNALGKPHPTQKPLALMQWLVSTYSNPGDLVLDPFAGSGSTLVAAASLGRQFRGAEIDPAYHAIAERRVREAVPQLLGAM